MSESTGASHVLMVTGARDWDDIPVVTRAIAEVFDLWLSRPEPITSPRLFSGACPTGADQLAEQVWSQPGFPIQRHPADWSGQDRTAGLTRNQQMVDHAVAAQASGAVVTVLAFADLCKRTGCPQAEQDDLLQELNMPGHFSHGTMHARRAARAAGLDVLTVIHPALPPF